MMARQEPRTGKESNAYCLHIFPFSFLEAHIGLIHSVTARDICSGVYYPPRILPAAPPTDLLPASFCLAPTLARDRHVPMTHRLEQHSVDS